MQRIEWLYHNDKIYARINKEWYGLIHPDYAAHNVIYIPWSSALFLEPIKEGWLMEKLDKQYQKMLLKGTEDAPEFPT